MSRTTNSVKLSLVSPSVQIPDAATPEAQLFKALQTIFDEFAGDAVPTPMRRRHLHEAGRHAIDRYFGDKLHAMTTIKK